MSSQMKIMCVDYDLKSVLIPGFGPREKVSPSKQERNWNFS